MVNNRQGLGIEQFMERLGNGTFNARLHETLALVASEVIATGRQGAVNISLKLSCPDAGAEDKVVNISPSVKPVLPPRQSAVTSLYHYDGEFHRSPQTQEPFPEGVFNIEDGGAMDSMKTAQS